MTCYVVLLLTTLGALRTFSFAPGECDFSSFTQLQETQTFVFSRPRSIGKEAGVEMCAEIICV